MFEEDFPVREDKVDLNEIPGHYEVSGFSQRYAEYLEKAMQEAEEQDAFCANAAFVMMLIGGLLCVVGFLTILFGPSRVFIASGGPSFSQLIQLYPGPILTIGALIWSIAGWLSTNKQKPCMDREQYLLHGWRMAKPDGTDYGKALVIIYVENDTFYIGDEYPPVMSPVKD